jgi:hypothetical protein
MDAAELFGIPVISSVDVPIFNERNVQKMVRAKSKIEPT